MSAQKKVLQTSARTTVRLPDEVHRRAKLAAAWSGRKIQEFVATALEEYLKNVEAEMHDGAKGPGAKSLARPKPRGVN